MSKCWIRIAIFMLFLLAIVPRLPAQNLREPQFMERAQAAFRDIMNLDYDKALNDFAALERDYPAHPAPPLYAASIYWLKEMLHRQDVSLNRFISPMYFTQKTRQTMPAADRQAFFQSLLKSENSIQAILKRNPKDKDARYFLGTAYGLRASFAITIDHSLKDAFSNGRKTFYYARQLINEDPNYYDAYLTTGLYEYIVANIPWYWKWMAAVVGIRGNANAGIKQIKLAAEKGQYVNNESRLILMVLYVKEQRYNEARVISQNLHSRFPRSFLFALSNAQILRMAGFKEQAAAEYLAAEKKIEARDPNFDKVPLQIFRYQLGEEFMHMDMQDFAEERLRLCLQDPQTPSRERTLAHLNLGRVLSWKKGSKEEATKECQLVLALPEINDSHDQAKYILRKLRKK